MAAKNSTNAQQIANYLIDRQVAPTNAYRAAAILDHNDVTIINVRNAYRLGRGITWDLIENALDIVVEEREDARASVAGRERDLAIPRVVRRLTVPERI